MCSFKSCMKGLSLDRKKACTYARVELNRKKTRFVARVTFELICNMNSLKNDIAIWQKFYTYCISCSISKANVSRKTKNVEFLSNHDVIFGFKVQLFWEGHKNVRNRPYSFEIYLVNVKTIRTIAQIFVAFSEKLNFNDCQLGHGVFKFWVQN